MKDINFALQYNNFSFKIMGSAKFHQNLREIDYSATEHYSVYNNIFDIYYYIHAGEPPVCM